MLSALWNAASMLTGGRESQESSPPATPNSAPVTHSSSSPALASDVAAYRWSSSFGDAGFSEEDLAGNNLPWVGSGSVNKLFIQLLDDLDDLTTNSPSAHRRRRAREIFSEWLFSADMRGSDVPGGLKRGDPLRRSSAAEYGLRCSDVSPLRVKADLKRLSGDFGDLNVVTGQPQGSPPLFRENLPRDFADRRQSLPLPQSLGSGEQTDQDSGYHTGSGREFVTAKRIPSQQTLTREDLRRRITAFNNNNHGLLMDPPSTTNNTFQGFIRVHMNLIRPINMRISLPPPTIFDVCPSSDSATQHSFQVTSFYLPKNTTKVIHIDSTATTQEVIRILLSKFHITDNPRKFALYEKTEQPGKTAVMRRICDEELPLQICLSWTDEGLGSLDHSQFVLQENETGEILWEAFCLPELENFLTILNREEEEYIEQVKAKYRLLKIQMKKRLHKMEQNAGFAAGDKRTPVFV